MLCVCVCVCVCVCGAHLGGRQTWSPDVMPHTAVGQVHCTRDWTAVPGKTGEECSGNI